MSWDGPQLLIMDTEDKSDNGTFVPTAKKTQGLLTRNSRQFITKFVLNAY